MHREMGIEITECFRGEGVNKPAAITVLARGAEGGHSDMESPRARSGTVADSSQPSQLWIMIPRTEEFHERHLLGRGGARTTFVLQIHCKGAAGAGSAQTWELKKRYGYFERIHRLALKCAEAVNEPPPALPRRKIINHRDPKYLAALREELQQYMEHVVALVTMGIASSGEGVDGVLQRLELPMASESASWEQVMAGSGQAQPVALEGFLRKQGGSKRGKGLGWKERWFILTGSSLHYYQHRDDPKPKGCVEVKYSWVGELEAAGAEADAEENFVIVLRLADAEGPIGREVRLAAASLALRSEWVMSLSRAVAMPPSPPPPPGTRDKRIAQLESHTVQDKLLAQESAAATAARTLTAADERGGGPTRLQLLDGAQAAGRQWQGFNARELQILLDTAGLRVQRVARRDHLVKTGEMSTFFGIVLQGTLALTSSGGGGGGGGGGGAAVLRYAGDFFGESELFDGGPRAADAIATADGHVATMTYRQLETLATSHEERERAVGDKLNQLLAKATLIRNLAAQQGFDEKEEVLLYNVDVDREVAALRRRQREHHWESTKHSAALEAEFTYRHAMHMAPSKKVATIPSYCPCSRSHSLPTALGLPSLPTALVCPPFQPPLVCPPFLPPLVPSNRTPFPPLVPRGRPPRHHQAARRQNPQAARPPEHLEAVHHSQLAVASLHRLML